MVKSCLQENKNKIAGTDSNEVQADESDEEEYINRNMLMMPPSARGQCEGFFVYFCNPLVFFSVFCSY